MVKNGRPGAAGADDNAARFQMVDALGVGIGFADRRHGNGREHPCINALALQHALHGQRVHHRRHDAHMVGRDTFHALGCACNTPEDVAAANDERQLGAELLAGDHLIGDAADHVEVDAIGLLSHQHFARDLEEYPAMRKFAHSDCPITQPSCVGAGNSPIRGKGENGRQEPAVNLETRLGPRPVGANRRSPQYSVPRNITLP